MSQQPQPKPLTEENLRVDQASSLDRLETSPSALLHPLAYQSPAQKRIHHRHRSARAAIIQSLWCSEDPAMKRRSERLSACVAAPILLQSESGRVCVSLARCRDRICPFCVRKRSQQVQARVLSAVQKFDSIRFVTLTRKATRDSLDKRLADLDAAWAKLRKSEVWRETVSRCIAVVEVTRGQHQQWHAHLHIITDGKYIPQPRLKKAWLEATGDSDIVHVEQVNSRQAAAKYVAKYVSVGDTISTWRSEQIREYADAMHGKRLVRTYGGVTLTGDDEDEESQSEKASERVCPVNWIIQAADAGSEVARHAIDVLSRVGRDEAAAVGREPDRSVCVPVEDAEHRLVLEVARVVSFHWPVVPDESLLERARRIAFGQEDPQPPPVDRASFFDDLPL